ncbi:hypothetical protein KDA08_03240, partial [Candidatus Saccharibacteria bacterium]|nr:hypothetical protein [Candidatus Saccharibacteria bacterium]
MTIVNKEGKEVPFILNKAQNYVAENGTGKDFVLKARQEGVSAFELAVFTGDFLLSENSTSVVVADNADNAQGLLERVKWYISSFERNNNTKVPLKYNSKYELHNAANNAKYIIGTAQNVEVGRSRTIKNAHLSEALFYPHFRKLLASILQAVVPGGKVMIESTANGFGDGKEYWDETVLGNTGFNPIFLPASFLYDKEFLDTKKKELGRLYDQEYPESAEIAFLTSGEGYFDQEA